MANTNGMRHPMTAKSGFDFRGSRVKADSVFDAVSPALAKELFKAGKAVYGDVATSDISTKQLEDPANVAQVADAPVAVRRPRPPAAPPVKAEQPSGEAGDPVKAPGALQESGDTDAGGTPPDTESAKATDEAPKVPESPAKDAAKAAPAKKVPVKK